MTHPRVSKAAVEYDRGIREKLLGFHESPEKDASILKGEDDKWLVEQGFVLMDSVPE